MDKETETETSLLEDLYELHKASNNEVRTSESKPNITIDPQDSRGKIPFNDKETQTDDDDDSGENTSQRNEINSEKSQAMEVLKEVGLFAAKAALISGGVLGGIALAVPAMGFGAGGVAAHSLAALYQSTFLGGTIASGSTFAVLQSVGAAGLAASTQVAVVAGSVAATGVQTILSKASGDNRSDPPNDVDKEHGGANGNIPKCESDSSIADNNVDGTKSEVIRDVDSIVNKDSGKTENSEMRTTNGIEKDKTKSHPENRESTEQEDSNEEGNAEPRNNATRDQDDFYESGSDDEKIR